MSKVMKDMPAWGISLVINLSILGAFNFIVYKKNSDADITSITSIVDDLNQEEYDFSEAIQEDQIGTEGDALSMNAAMSATTAISDSKETPQEQVEEFLNPEIVPIADASMVAVEGDLSKPVDVKGVSEDSIERGVEGAMDRVSFEIRQSLRERKTMVIWLFDASGSLDKRRKDVADRFDNIYKQLGQLGTTEGLHSVVISYGAGVNLLTPEPIQDVAELSKVVREKIVEDKSGKENVFTAAKMALEKYRTWHRFDGPMNKLVFIVTDEKGDDAPQLLEDVISLAKRSQTRFYCIGNAAIFGQEKGFVEWTYDDGFVEYLPVDQGPESAFPDGVQLPFVGSGQDWKLHQMSASYGPYALTRLCAETGGMYLITAESRGYSFDRSIMRSYAPSYAPVRVQEQDIFKNPAKASLVSVAKMTYNGNLPVPNLVFRGYNDNILRTDLGDSQREIADVDYKLEPMHRALEIGVKARDTIREPRWQAAFDLAMGRILAMRVRYSGYNKTLANMKVNPKAFSNEKMNMWRLVPSSTIDSGPDMRKAATTSKEYLKRVVDEHPGTPWAALAAKELSTELGWEWQEYSEPIPGGNGMTRASDEEVARLLLAEEEEKKTMQTKAAKPRPKPNL